MNWKNRLELLNEFGSVSIVNLADDTGWGPVELDGASWMATFKNDNVKVKDAGKPVCGLENPRLPTGAGDTKAQAVNALFNSVIRGEEVRVYSSRDRRRLVDVCKWERTSQRFRPVDKYEA